MEKQTAVIGNEEITDCLEKLKNSPIVQDEFYHVQLQNLCDTIDYLSNDAGFEIELINEDIKKGTIQARSHLIENLQKRFWLISTVAEVIKEKIMNNDFVELSNLFYYYKKYKGEE